MQAFKKGIEERLCSHEKFTSDLTVAMSETIAGIELELLDDENVNSDYSGCTLVLAVIRGLRMTIANVGDSRVTVVSRKSACQFAGTAITVDHKPELIEEKARIISAGGRVFPVRYPDGVVGPERVWLGNVDSPGLCMSRSMGDRIVHTVGVSSSPEFFEYDICTASDCAIIVATDGLWSVTTDQEAAEQALSCKEPSSAVGLLLRESHKRWVQSGDSIDDTTVCVAFLECR